MRAGSPNQFCTIHPLRGSQPECKSLFRNILAASPFGSRFCRDRTLSATHKFLRMSILGNHEEKIVRGISSQNQSRQRTEDQ
jgi:hypothetical protein